MNTTLVRGAFPLTGALLLLAACGGSNAASPAVSTSAVASGPAKPSLAAATSAAPPATPKASTAASPPAAAKPSGPLTPLKTAFLSFQAGSATQWIAKDAGIFAKYGIDADPQYLAPATLTQAVISGSIDVGQGSSASLITAVGSGADIIAIGSNVQFPIYEILTQNGINDLKDLRGKKISGGPGGSTGDLLVKKLMQDLGMTVGTDYSQVPLPDEAGELAALASRQVDAAILSEPASSLAVKQGQHVIYDQKATGARDVGGPVMMRKSFLASHQELMANFLKAYLEAQHLLKTDPQKAASYTASHMSLDDLSVVTRAMQQEGDLMDGYMSTSSESLAIQIKQVAAATSPKVAELKPSDVADLTLLNSIISSGFVSQLYGGNPPVRAGS
jgi:NitT/TauT family transport system substrate-binding protein